MEKNEQHARTTEETKIRVQGKHLPPIHTGRPAHTASRWVTRQSDVTSKKESKGTHKKLKTML